MNIKRSSMKNIDANERTRAGQAERQSISGVLSADRIGEEENMKFLNPYRILFAEDDEDSLDLVSMICELSDIQIVKTRTVAEAWQLAHSHRFDLYLLDSRFPDGDGVELCRRLRSFDSQTPILIYSGNAYEADKKKGLAAGATEYLIKPYFGDLAETIRRHIDQSRAPVRRAISNIRTETPPDLHDVFANIQTVSPQDRTM
jgi:DNA-binding response OmpR family regulator